MAQDAPRGIWLLPSSKPFEKRMRQQVSLCFRVDLHMHISSFNVRRDNPITTFVPTLTFCRHGFQNVAVTVTAPLRLGHQ